MATKSPKNLMLLVLSVSLAIGAVLTGGCAGKETETPVQITEDITPQEAFTLILENQNNPDFVIIDVRTPERQSSTRLQPRLTIDLSSNVWSKGDNQWIF